MGMRGLYHLACLKNLSSSSWCSGLWVCELQWKWQGAEVWPAGLMDMMLSTAVFADVSGCRVKASIAGVDEGTAGDQVSISPPHLRGLLGSPRPCFVTCFGGNAAAAAALWSCLVPLASGWGPCSSAVLQPGRLDWFEGRVGKGNAERGWWAVCYITGGVRVH